MTSDTENRSRTAPDVPSGAFAERVAAADSSALRAEAIDVLELNVGYRCTLSCSHCHVEASPVRTEAMAAEVFSAALILARRLRPGLVDITGGAPELHPDVSRYVRELGAAGFPVRMRTNLVSLLEPAAAGLAKHLASEHVTLLASLPSVDPAEVDSQRGPGVWDRSIVALRVLGDLGYGTADGPALDIAANPTGPGLPQDRTRVETRFREALGGLGIRFGRFVLMTNVPIGRHRRALRSAGGLRAYEDLLAASFNAATLPLLACRRSIAVAWDGTLWDCDYNLAAGTRPMPGVAKSVTDERADERLRTRRIAFADHCAACAAASGSS
jgi:radical SAM/Cys-rich protein